MKKMDEKELLKAFENGELVQVPDVKGNIEKAQVTSQGYFTKSERINIRLSKVDLERVKRVAATEGMPYQTLISSVLHKYVAKYLDLDEKR
ncbi:conserved hypothetical protein [Alphaproteobacteria bacterium]